MDNKKTKEKEPYLVSAFEACQGRRPTMEDTHVAIDNIQKEFPHIGPHKRCAFYGVYDGHGGKEVAELVQKHLHVKVINHPDFEKDTLNALSCAFRQTDEIILKESQEKGFQSGSTAAVVVLIDDTCYVANVGDSEAILGRRNKDNDLDAVLITHKHKPTDESERERIKGNGGYVVLGRVMGSLAVARSFGDKNFKMPLCKGSGDFVSCEPFVAKYDIQSGDEFLVVSCDGLWDRNTPQTAAKFVEKFRDDMKQPQPTVEALVKNAIDRGSLDNVTSILVYITPPLLPRSLSIEEIGIFEFLKEDPPLNPKKIKAEEKTRKKIIKRFSLPPGETPLEDHKCVLEARMSMHHGRFLITKNYLCFYGKKKKVLIPVSSIQTLEKKSLLIASGIRIGTQDGQKYVFNYQKSSGTRDKIFRSIAERMEADGIPDDCAEEATVTSTRDSSKRPTEEEVDDDEEEDDDDDEDEEDDQSVSNWSRFDD